MGTTRMNNPGVQGMLQAMAGCGIDFQDFQCFLRKSNFMSRAGNALTEANLCAQESDRIVEKINTDLRSGKKPAPSLLSDAAGADEDALRAAKKAGEVAREPESFAKVASACAIGNDMLTICRNGVGAEERAFSAGNSAKIASRLK